MKVYILKHDAPDIIAKAARLCYYNKDIPDLLEDMDKSKCEKLINKLMLMGHESPLEHCSFTFGIEGISRCCANQLVRHRIASYSQQSQRYVKEDQFDYIIPEKIERNSIAKNKYIKLMEQINKLYNGYLEAGFHQEDARYILPNACETKIIVTMNIRSLKNFFKLRCCNRSQTEIRNLANKMLKLCRTEIPYIFNKIGPACVFDKCPEGEMSCQKRKD